MTHLNAIITFNTSRFLQRQYDLFKKHVQGDFVVIDNSTDYTKSAEIKAICKKNGIDYTKTQINEADHSKSHAYALNVALGLYRDAHTSILMCDHDIFPLKPIELPQAILAGIQQIRKSPKYHGSERITFNYMWPGLLYLDTKQLKGVELDFMPCEISDTFLDTGGQLFKIIAGNPDRIKYFEEKHMETEVGIYALIEGNWMHLIKGSNWLKEEESVYTNRIDKLMQILEANVV